VFCKCLRKVLLYILWWQDIRIIREDLKIKHVTWLTCLLRINFNMRTQWFLKVVSSLEQCVVFQWMMCVKFICNKRPKICLMFSYEKSSQKFLRIGPRLILSWSMVIIVKNSLQRVHIKLNVKGLVVGDFRQVGTCLHDG